MSILRNPLKNPVNIIPKLAAISASAVAWNGYWTRRYGGLAEPDETHRIKTKSGISFALSRFQPSGAARKKYPVLLCHGLSGNHFLMDPYPSPSLARTLAGHGYDTWAIDLRFAGFSEKPEGIKARFARWDFDDYLEQEIPAALAYVLEKTTAPQAHFLGHSMGGMLLLCLLMTEKASLIRSGVTVASALDFNGAASDFAKMARARALIIRLNSLPLHAFSNFLIPFTGRMSNAIERFSYWQENVTPEMARRIHASYFERIPSMLLVQLATILEPGGMKNRDHSIRYLDRIGEIRTPLLSIAADRDRQCPRDAARATFERIGSEAKEFLAFGMEHGQPTHYGHMDLLIGKRAEKEVFPQILSWIDRYED